MEKHKQILNLETKLQVSRTRNLATSSSLSSPYYSPPSSPFVSALQSPYVSPRTTPTSQTTTPPLPYSSPHFDDIPSTSSTRANIAAPRVSFSFPAPRSSFIKGSVSSSNTKLRSCDVYIGYNGENQNLIRLCKWLKSELEMHGIACFVADREKYVDSQSHEIAERVICSVAYGVVVVTRSSVLNHFSLEELRFFEQKKNLIPIFFNIDVNEISQHSDSKELKEVVDGLMKFQGSNLVANQGNWRSCVSRTLGVLTSKLGRKSGIEKEIEVLELPFSRNGYFVGRQTEIAEMETTFFGGGEGEPLEFEELDEDDKEVEITRYKKSKSGSVVCINGLPGIGKTELALEYAYMHSQRYKMVLWVGGEARYFRQNILNLSIKLGLDVSADDEKDRGRIRTFDEQASEAFKRVKMELFRDLPYLLIIDNLETDNEWWEGKDLHDLIPRNTRGTHVIITTRLSKVMSLDPMQLQPLQLPDAMILIKGSRRSDYRLEDCEYLKIFDEKLGRLTFGLALIGSLLAELAILPSALFEAINQMPFEEVSAAGHQFFRTNPFLMKVLAFCVAVLHQSNGSVNLLAAKMLEVGGWFAPSPVSANVLAAAAKHLPAPKKKLGNWTRCLKQTFFCGSGCLTEQAWKIEDDSALLLDKLGLARRANGQPGCWIQFHNITQVFSKRKDGLVAAKAMVQGVRKAGSLQHHQEHLWASTFLVFGFKTELPLVPLNASEMVFFIKKTALPLAMGAFTAFSRCNSALELLKVCTDVLEEAEKSFVTQIQDWCHDSFCWKKTRHSYHKVDEHVWKEVTLLKATIIEARAKLSLRGGHFDHAEELCRTCISIRTVMLGHNHAQTLDAQETLAKLVRMRSKTQH